ncbi:MAG: phosphotransacetylase family protein [Nitrososphaerota archaeon]|nr:phosphotransacetylase family protein [Candidatus Bathyarchaeota archaeon]MDW8061134.1 phosphotransacetylase family protein [Nitrososphaerota archaeon]
MTGCKGLYIISPMDYSGKTAFCVGLALTLREEGYRVGYMKPVGLGTSILEEKYMDEDSILMRDILGLEDRLDDITPYVAGDRILEDVAKGRLQNLCLKIVEAYRRLSDGKDIVIVEAPRNVGFNYLTGLNYRFIAEKLGCKAMIISLFESDADIGYILQMYEHMKLEGLQAIGVILNYVRRHIIERAKGVASSILGSYGVNVLGVIPRKNELVAPTVAEIYERIGGEVLTREDRLGNIVEEIMIGAMTLESALHFFRRAVSKAVITGGDRADIALAALETDTSVLILTGNLYPDVRVLARAEEKGVPVILVPYDTYTTVELVGELVGRIKPGDRRRVDIAYKLVRENVDWRRIAEAL